MNTTKLAWTVIVFALFALLSGCGGGDREPLPPNVAVVNGVETIIPVNCVANPQQCK